MGFMRNPALDELEFLVGEWRVVASNAEFLPEGGTEPWTVSIAWLDDAFLIWRGDARGVFPRSVQITGRNENDPPGTYSVLYFDGRGVSRIYAMTLRDNVWTMWRADADFHQRFVGRISADRQTITAYWEASETGVEWRRDFDLEYTRLAD
jgi:hypothetical protein